MRRLALVFFVLLSVSALPAHALTISGAAITLLDSPVGGVPVNGVAQEYSRSAAITAQTASSVSARWAAVLSMDTSTSANYAFITVAPQWKLTFQVNAAANELWEISSIDSRRTGAFTFVNEGSSDAYAQLNGVTLTVRVNGSPVNPFAWDNLHPAGGLPHFTGTSTQVIPFNQIDSLIPGGSFMGPASVEFEFLTLQMSAISNGGTTVDGDEAAIRLGRAGSSAIGATSADDYPGYGSRNINNDGHFVTATVASLGLVVPEPGAGLLLACAGLAGLLLRVRGPRAPLRRRARWLAPLGLCALGMVPGAPARATLIGDTISGCVSWTISGSTCAEGAGNLFPVTSAAVADPDVEFETVLSAGSPEQRFLSADFTGTTVTITVDGTKQTRTGAGSHEANQWRFTDLDWSAGPIGGLVLIVDGGLGITSFVTTADSITITSDSIPNAALAGNSFSATFQIVPEVGALALVGLGLAGLALQGRRPG